MKKYLAYAKMSIITALEYRGYIFGVLLEEFLTIGSILILWTIIFLNKDTIGGLNYEQTLIYYLLVPLIGFITRPNVSEKLAQSIRSGDLSNTLLKPNKVASIFLAFFIGEKFLILVLVLPFYFALFGFLAIITQHIFFSLQAIILSIILITGAFFLHFVMDLCVSYIAFWWHDIWSFRHFKYILIAIFGGVFFPLAFLPSHFSKFFYLLPFHYIYSTPISYLTRERSLNNLGYDLAILLLWILFFIIIGKLMWQKGLKKYDSYGN